MKINNITEIDIIDRIHEIRDTLSDPEVTVEVWCKAIDQGRKVCNVIKKSKEEPANVSEG